MSKFWSGGHKIFLKNEKEWEKKDEVTMSFSGHMPHKLQIPWTWIPNEQKTNLGVVWIVVSTPLESTFKALFENMDLFCANVDLFWTASFSLR